MTDKKPEENRVQDGLNPWSKPMDDNPTSQSYPPQIFPNKIKIIDLQNTLFLFCGKKYRVGSMAEKSSMNPYSNFPYEHKTLEFIEVKP